MYKYKETDEYVQAVEDYLTEMYGEVKPTWRPLLHMLGDQYDLFQLSKDDVFNSGIMLQGTKGMVTNPSVKIMTDCNVQIRQLVEQLGISPKQEIRLKTGKPKETEDNFLDELTE